MDSKAQRLVQLKGQLWVTSTKLKGLGHLIKYQNGEQILGEEDAAGIGEIICDLGHEIEAVHESLDKLRVCDEMSL